MSMAVFPKYNMKKTPLIFILVLFIMTSIYTFHYYQFQSKQKQLNLYFQILELREIDSTMSIRNIADELKTTKSKVETALKNWSNVDVSDFKRTYM